MGCCTLRPRAGGEMVKFPGDVARAGLPRYPFEGNYMRYMANVGARRQIQRQG